MNALSNARISSLFEFGVIMRVPTSFISTLSFPRYTTVCSSLESTFFFVSAFWATFAVSSILSGVCESFVDRGGSPVVFGEDVFGRGTSLLFVAISATGGLYRFFFGTSSERIDATQTDTAIAMIVVHPKREYLTVLSCKSSPISPRIPVEAVVVQVSVCETAEVFGLFLSSASWITFAETIRVGSLMRYPVGIGLPFSSARIPLLGLYESLFSLMRERMISLRFFGIQKMSSSFPYEIS